MTDRERSEGRLREARLCVVLGKEHLARQHQVMLDLEGVGGKRFGEGLQLMHNLQRAQSLYAARVERLQKELQEAQRCWPDRQPALEGSALPA